MSVEGTSNYLDGEGVREKGDETGWGGTGRKEWLTEDGRLEEGQKRRGEPSPRVERNGDGPLLLILR